MASFNITFLLLLSLSFQISSSNEYIRNNYDMRRNYRLKRQAATCGPYCAIISSADQKTCDLKPFTKKFINFTAARPSSSKTIAFAGVRDPFGKKISAVWEKCDNTAIFLNLFRRTRGVDIVLSYPRHSRVLKKMRNTCRKRLGTVQIYNVEVKKKEASCAVDGLLQDIGSVVVTSSDPGIDSETCSAVMISAKSSDNCLSDSNSGAAQYVGNIVKKLMVKSPKMTWREVQHAIVKLADSSTLPNTAKRNAAGMKYSNRFGFGTLDAKYLYKKTILTKRLIVANKYLVKFFNPSQNSAHTPYKQTRTYTSKVIQYIDWVTLDYWLKHNDKGTRGSFNITVVSPSGTESVLLPLRPSDTFNTVTADTQHLIKTAAFWGEKPQGNWTVRIGGPAEESLMTVNLTIYGLREAPSWQHYVPPPPPPPSVGGLSLPVIISLIVVIIVVGAVAGIVVLWKLGYLNCSAVEKVVHVARNLRNNTEEDSNLLTVSEFSPR